MVIVMVVTAMVGDSFFIRVKNRLPYILQASCVPYDAKENKNWKPPSPGIALAEDEVGPHGYDFITGFLFPALLTPPPRGRGHLDWPPSGLSLGRWARRGEPLSGEEAAATGA